MKRFISIAAVSILVIAVILIVLVFTPRTVNPDRLYPLTARVSELDYSRDTVVFEDDMGFHWAMYGIEDWQPGDSASLLMHDNGTASIYDDKIITARFSTWNLN